MKFYFLRHADALDGMDDDARPLSPAGHEQARQLARFLRHAGVEFDAAFTSPLTRARETAELVLDITNKACPVKLKTADALRNETPPGEFARWLAALPVARHVLLVGHEPTISQRVRQLVGVAHPAGLSFPKGALACVETGHGHGGELKFFVSPKSLGG